MFNANVLRNGVAAPAAAAESERRSELEVVNIADTALRARSIDENTAGFHAGSKGIEFFPLIHCIQIDGRGMAIAAIFQQALGFLNSFLEGLLGSLNRLLIILQLLKLQLIWVKLIQQILFHCIIMHLYKIISK